MIKTSPLYNNNTIESVCCSCVCTMNELFRYKYYKKNKNRTVFFASASVHLLSCCVSTEKLFFDNLALCCCCYRLPVFSVRVSRFVTYAHMVNHNATKKRKNSSIIDVMSIKREQTIWRRWKILIERKNCMKTRRSQMEYNTKRLMMDEYQGKGVNLIYGARRDDKMRKTNIN